MNASFEPKRQQQSQNTSRNRSQSAKAFPSRTIVHAKLEMTEPGDHDEQEADAMANTVISGGKIARKISSGGSGSSGIAVSSQMESQLNHLQGGGQAMPKGLRSMMESGFGQDFGQVRLHTDSEAASMSNSIHAKAFTHGNDIYFNQGQFSPNTAEGQRLVAHELTHVVQGGGKVAREDDKKDDDQDKNFKFNLFYKGLQGGKYLNLFEVEDSLQMGLFVNPDFSIVNSKVGIGFMFPENNSSFVISYKHSDSEEVSFTYIIPKNLSAAIDMQIQQKKKEIVFGYGASFKYTPHINWLESLSASIKGIDSSIKNVSFSYAPFEWVEATYNYKTNEHRFMIMVDIGRILNPHEKNKNNAIPNPLPSQIQMTNNKIFNSVINKGLNSGINYGINIINEYVKDQKERMQQDPKTGVWETIPKKKDQNENGLPQ